MRFKCLYAFSLKEKALLKKTILSITLPIVSKLLELQKIIVCLPYLKASFFGYVLCFFLYIFLACITPSSFQAICLKSINDVDHKDHESARHRNVAGKHTHSYAIIALWGEGHFESHHVCS